MVALQSLTQVSRDTVRLLFLDGPALSTSIPRPARSEMIVIDMITEASGWTALTARGMASAVEAGYGIEKDQRAQNYVWVPR